MMLDSHFGMSTALTLCQNSLFVKNLRFKPLSNLGANYLTRLCGAYERSAMNLADFEDSYIVTPEELFDLFGKFGPIRYNYLLYMILPDTGLI
jgi:RNA recognition motif-containing protein